jgi:small conductance mechanosensitive channel
MPLRQWTVGRELRRRLKLAYDESGVEFPFPTRTLNIAGRPPEIT